MSKDKWIVRVRHGDGDRDWEYGYLTREQYDQFIESQAWQDLRREIIERDGGKCVLCHTTEHLQVHHRNYVLDVRTGIIGGDLVTLCKKHHGWVHGKYVDRREKKMFKLEGFEL